MSSIFSDPGWRRGTTLLSGELIEYSDAPTNSIPTAGAEIVGQMKVFQDVNPYSGVRYSNHLVYCVAARYKGSTSLTSSDAGKVFVFDKDGPLTNFSTLAANTDVVDGRLIGVLDEYLTVTVRTNDIVWLVVSGPSTMAKGATVVIPASSGIEASSGLAVVKTSNDNVIATSIGGTVLIKTGTASSASTALTVTDGTGIVVGMPVSGTGIASGTYVSAVSGTSVTLSANTSAAISAGSLVIGGALRTDTTVRVNMSGWKP